MNFNYADEPTVQQTAESLRFQTGYKFWPCGRAGSMLEEGELWIVILFIWYFSTRKSSRPYIHAGKMWVLLPWHSTLEKPFKIIKPVSQLLPLFPWLYCYSVKFSLKCSLRNYSYYENFKLNQKVAPCIVWPSSCALGFEIDQKNFLQLFKFHCLLL